MPTYQDQPLINALPAVLGDTGIVAANLAAWTFAYADKASVPRLQYLYVRRDAIAALMGTNWTQVTQKTGDFTESLSDRVKALALMKAETDADILLTMKTAGGQRIGAIGTLTQTSPVTQKDGLAQAQQPGGYPDANAPWVAGSPYSRGPWRG